MNCTDIEIKLTKTCFITFIDITNGIIHCKCSMFIHYTFIYIVNHVTEMISVRDRGCS